MASNKPPAFQFYAADYLADMDVQLMTLEQEGVYIRLLAYCWREGSIPADPKSISRLCKGASEEAVTGVLDRFIPLDSDASRLTSPRLNAEREKLESWRTLQAEKGRASGKSRKSKKLHTEPRLNRGSISVEPKTNSSSSYLSTNTPPPHARDAKPEPPSPEAEPAWDENAPPPGLPMLAYARGMLETLAVPLVMATEQAAAAAIGAIRKEFSLEAHTATAQLTRLARDAISRGETVDKWWFTDAKWRKKSGGSSNGTARIRSKTDGNLEALRQAIEGFDHGDADSAGDLSAGRDRGRGLTALRQTPVVLPSARCDDGSGADFP